LTANSATGSGRNDSHCARTNALRVEIAYEAGQGNLDRYARSFQSVALLEALSDYDKISQIEPVDKNVNDTNRIVLVDPILQAFRKQRARSSILALNEALHLIPRISRGNPHSRITPDAAFLHSLGQNEPCYFLVRHGR
jgi:hypothetical protein